MSWKTPKDDDPINAGYMLGQRLRRFPRKNNNTKPTSSIMLADYVPVLWRKVDRKWGIFRRYFRCYITIHDPPPLLRYIVGTNNNAPPLCCPN